MIVLNEAEVDCLLKLFNKSIDELYNTDGIDFRHFYRERHVSDVMKLRNHGKMSVNIVGVDFSTSLNIDPRGFSYSLKIQKNDSPAWMISLIHLFNHGLEVVHLDDGDAAVLVRDLACIKYGV